MKGAGKDYSTPVKETDNFLGNITLSGDPVIVSDKSDSAAPTQATVDPTVPSLRTHFDAHSSHGSTKDKMAIKLEEQDLQDALKYLYKTATKEVKFFNNSDKISKTMVEKNGILFLKSRISEGQRFVQAAELEGTDILRSQGINVLTPVLDRHSTLSYSITNHVHCNVAKHSGYEMCSRVSQCFVHIMKGTSLYQELAEDCIVCKKARKRFIQAAMGPIHPSKFVVAPPFWTTQADLWGPMVVYVPGREKNTRSSKTLDASCYVLVFMCCLSKAVNLQIIESKSIYGICDGITRLACERGLPSHFLVDQESSLMKSLREGKMTVIDLQNHLQTKVSLTYRHLSCIWPECSWSS